MANNSDWWYLSSPFAYRLVAAHNLPMRADVFDSKRHLHTQFTWRVVAAAPLYD